jgi:hypothetical protein
MVALRFRKILKFFPGDVSKPRPSFGRKAARASYARCSWFLPLSGSKSVSCGLSFYIHKAVVLYLYITRACINLVLRIKIENKEKT